LDIRTFRELLFITSPGRFRLREFLLSKMEIKRRTNQLEAEIRKPLKGYCNPLRGLITSSSDNPTFSFYSPEGKRLGFWVNRLSVENYEWNSRSNRNVVKRKLELFFV
jgi:hypothetical protein